MRRASSLKRRVKEIEGARGAGAVSLTFGDGSTLGFNFSRKDRLKLLLASFDIARRARNPDAEPSTSPRAVAIARQIADAKQVTPHSRLWDTIKGTILNAERECTNRAPEPASDSFSEAKSE